jgi:hypothetical protein
MDPIDLSRVRTIPLGRRSNKASLAGSAAPPRPGKTCAAFVAGLPGTLAGADFRSVVAAIVEARRGGHPVVWGLGAHVIKCGLSPVVIDLMERGIVQAVALNGSGAVHDVELALIGETSEDVASGLADGTFGMARETGELINRSIQAESAGSQRGMGAILGDALAATGAPFRAHSLLANGRRLGIPVTVHVAIGTDIVHMHPSADGAAIGRASFLDFRIFTAVVASLSGGVYLNIGSAVILPEVFLKALTVARNLGHDLREFVTVNMDMLAHYRPGENVVRRPSVLGKAGYTLIGRHEIMVPLMAQAVVDALEGN